MTPTPGRSTLACNGEADGSPGPQANLERDNHRLGGHLGTEGLPTTNQSHKVWTVFPFEAWLETAGTDAPPTGGGAGAELDVPSPNPAPVCATKR